MGLECNFFGGDTPEGYTYVGKGIDDINADYKENTSLLGRIFGSGPDIDWNSIGAVVKEYNASDYVTSISIVDNPGTFLAGGPVGAVKKISAGYKTLQSAKTSTKTITSYYPQNSGALGKWSTEYLKPGMKIDRFGDVTGKYFSPSGTPMYMRALPPNANTSLYNSYQVMKPFPVQSSTIAPAFNQMGLGRQYLSPVSAEILLKRKIIVPIK